MTEPIFQSLHADIKRLVESLQHDATAGLSLRQLALIEISLLAIQQDMVLQFAARGLQLSSVAADCLRESLDSALTELADALFKHQNEPFATSQLYRIHGELERLYQRFDESLEVRVDELYSFQMMMQSSDIAVPLCEILATLDDCIRLLADYDEHEGDEVVVYRRCKSLRKRLTPAAVP